VRQATVVPPPAPAPSLPQRARGPAPLAGGGTAPSPLAVRLEDRRDPVRLRFGHPPRSGLLFELDTGRVLWRRAPTRVLPIASLTKMMTALLVAERLPRRARVPITDEALRYRGSGVGLLPRGRRIRVDTMLHGLMLPSGNDAAIAIARYVAGSETAFAELMNAKARQLGLQHSRFVNPHGLEEPGHYSSPYDMAMISRAAMRSPYFRRLASAKEWSASGLLRSYRLVNLNRLLWQYPGADGVKIGYEDTAINTMVVSAMRDGHRVYASFMRSTRRDADGSALLDYAFSAYAWPTP
jgi:serine-type D-Ala-D-Ala carboxypeptidase (penicillin-binding protein 5/6)